MSHHRQPHRTWLDRWDDLPTAARLAGLAVFAVAGVIAAVLIGMAELALLGWLWEVTR